jgi:hypothetical protein
MEPLFDNVSWCHDMSRSIEGTSRESALFRARSTVEPSDRQAVI